MSCATWQIKWKSISLTCSLAHPLNVVSYRIKNSIEWDIWLFKTRAFRLKSHSFSLSIRNGFKPVIVSSFWLKINDTESRIFACKSTHIERIVRMPVVSVELDCSRAVRIARHTPDDHLTFQFQTVASLCVAPIDKMNAIVNARPDKCETH